MSVLSGITSTLERGIGVPHEDEDKQFKWNDDNKGRDDDHKGRDDHSKHAKNDDDHKGRDDDHKGRDDHSKHAKNDDDHKGRDHKGRDDDHKSHDDHSKHAKNDDCSDDGRNDGYSKHGGKDEYSKDSKGDDSKHDGGWKEAKNDDCQPRKDDCQPHKDYCAPKPSDDCGKADTHGPGAELAKFDFSHGDLGSHGPDHAGDLLGALASMSPGHALDYAIGQMGPTDHFEVGHFDAPVDTSHDA
jgi:hypothetical protein